MQVKGHKFFIFPKLGQENPLNKQGTVQPIETSNDLTSMHGTSVAASKKRAVCQHCGEMNFEYNNTATWLISNKILICQ